jgi:cytoskeletal protein CcmA (bactofilin family)
MLKNSFLGRRDEPVTPVTSQRASPDSPRYAPQADAPPLAAVAVTPPGHAAGASTSARNSVDTRSTVAPSAITSAAADQSPAVDGNGTAAQSLGSPRLTVGPNIKLKGAEIDDCDTLVVEGHVEASMDSKTLEILKTGSYEGTVTIDIAEIHGRFSGNLTARRKLIVHASGCVSGVVRYGSLLVSEGGVVSGDIASIDSKGEAQSALFAGYPSARASGTPGSPGAAAIAGKGNGVIQHAAA